MTMALCVAVNAYGNEQCANFQQWWGRSAGVSCDDGECLELHVMMVVVHKKKNCKH
jgi:hypothetical protein